MSLFPSDALSLDAVADEVPLPPVVVVEVVDVLVVLPADTPLAEEEELLGILAEDALLDDDGAEPLFDEENGAEDVFDEKKLFACCCMLGTCPPLAPKVNLVLLELA